MPKFSAADTLLYLIAMPAHTITHLPCRQQSLQIVQSLLTNSKLHKLTKTYSLIIDTRKKNKNKTYIRLERKRQICAIILCITNKYLRVHFKSYLLLINDIDMPNYFFAKIRKGEEGSSHIRYYEGLNSGPLGNTPKTSANLTNTQLVHD